MTDTGPDIRIAEGDVREAAARGAWPFVALFRDAALRAVGGELTAAAIEALGPERVTLAAYCAAREELLQGGFVQLIHNGYGPFLFHNPFAKAMRLWGAAGFCDLMYRARRLYEQCGAELEADCGQDEFMALYERHPELDELDDEFVATEEEVTALVARHIDADPGRFATIVP